MTYNLLLWRWSDDYDTPAKRKKSGVKFGDITSAFARTGTHAAIGRADIDGFGHAVGEALGHDAEHRPFVLTLYEHCAVANYTHEVRLELVPKIAAIGRRFGLNASEF
ncbi:hypothetical protein [Burkholderia sp. Ac-20379]|uniref:hypothetical protein n=1 Tax=Burkholderia sp. Ac-20379 TaxID=2703900 RepID=UPI00197F1251|nr:hypothetical protein [Burkholderia sp. Ac-20379]MBN3723573.1 hypothetical protein [Burkholderia sp. Ac-20379]